MERIINRIKLFPNQNETSSKLCDLIQKKLKRGGFEIVETDYDLAIAIGGDGSFLRMVKQNSFASNVCYIGINAGTLGFLQEVKTSEIDILIDRLNHNDFKIDLVSIQETQIKTNLETTNFYSLNEIVLRDINLNTTILDVDINNEHFERYIGDGLLISTSVGSTAYNISFGGSIVYSGLHTLQITPIAPLNTKAYRDVLNSIIVPEQMEIVIVPEIKKHDLIVSIDGENKEYHHVIEIKTAVRGTKISCLRFQNYSFFQKINEKFLQDNCEH